jgi:hypothetical protein
MQMVAFAPGFAGIWRSSWPILDRNLHDALGLSADDQIVGFLSLGTALVTASEPNDDAPSRFVKVIWHQALKFGEVSNPPTSA